MHEICTYHMYIYNIYILMHLPSRMDPNVFTMENYIIDQITITITYTYVHTLITKDKILLRQS